jgi:hypothetical protein
MHRSQTLNICSNRRGMWGRRTDNRPGHTLQHPNCRTQYFFLVSTPSIQAHPTAGQPVHTQILTVRPDPMLADHMKELPGAKTSVPLLIWPGRHASSLNGEKLYQKDVKLGTSETRLSVMLALVYLSFLLPSACQTHWFSCLKKVLAWLLALSTQQK